MTRRLYIDEDPSEQLAVLLRADGHDAVTTREREHKGRSDPWQLMFAAREQRIIVTCNYKHFEMLHEAWICWSEEWGVQTEAVHPGILIVPNGREISIDQLHDIVAEIPSLEATLDNRYFRWRHSTGWFELIVPIS